ncbi:MAG: hypothetical protein IJF71_02345 [Clostridia bacterium]|nr:hypothetical protein [Clostridia bacterium]
MRIRELLSKGKLVIILLIGVLFLYLTNDFAPISIDKTLLIVATGVDYDGSSYRVSCQVAESDTSGGNTPQQNQVVVTGEGESISAAMDMLQQQTGWTPTFLFCYVIVLGEKTADYSISNTLDFFMRENEVNDAALLCFCAGTAEDFLKARTTLDSVSAHTVLKVLYQNNDKSENTVVCSLKDFTTKYFSQSPFCVLPFIGYKHQENGSGKKEQGDVQYSPGQAIVFDRDTKAEILSTEGLRLYNMLTKSIKEGNLQVTDISAENKHYDLMHFLYFSKKPSLKVSAENGKWSAVYELKLRIQVDNIEMQEKTPADVGGERETPKEIREYLQSREEKMLQEWILYMQKRNLDVFGLTERAFQLQPSAYRAYKEENPAGSLLQDTQLTVKVKIEGK